MEAYYEEKKRSSIGGKKDIYHDILYEIGCGKRKNY